MGLRNCAITPVHVGILQRSIGRWNSNERQFVSATRFKQQHFRATFRGACRNNAACRPGTYDDVIVHPLVLTHARRDDRGSPKRRYRLNQ